MTHSIYQDLISAWLDGELSGLEQSALRSHLDECSDCRKEWQALSRLNEHIECLAKPDAPPGLWEQIIEKMADDEFVHSLIRSLDSMGGMEELTKRIIAESDASEKKPSEKIVYFETARGRMVADSKRRRESHVSNLRSTARG